MHRYTTLEISFKKKHNYSDNFDLVCHQKLTENNQITPKTEHWHRETHYCDNEHQCEAEYHSNNIYFYQFYFFLHVKRSFLRILLKNKGNTTLTVKAPMSKTTDNEAIPNKVIMKATKSNTTVGSSKKNHKCL